jgi:hypothetical protein
MRFLILAPVAATLILAGCATPPAPPPMPAPPVARALPAPPPPAPADWRDRALTPGTWRLSIADGLSSAAFGVDGAAPLLTVRCDRAAGAVVIAVPGAAGALAVTTSYGTRTLPGPAVAARDRLLDEMAYSRGRVMISVGGGAALIVPAWPEFTRVVEDCRG